MTNRIPQNKLMTLQDVADYTQTSVSTVRRWISKGLLRAQYFGRTIRVRPADLDEMGQDVVPR